MAEFKVGQTVEMTDGRQAVIRYVGGIHVASGIFFGVELLDSSGKNDGSVKGERYFQCEASHGLFVRASSLQRVIVSKPPPPPKTTPKVALRRSIAPPSLARQAKLGPRPSTVPEKKPAPAGEPRKRITMANASYTKPTEASTRKRSDSNSSSGSASTSTSLSRRQLPKPSKTAKKIDPNVERLETTIRHLEKQLSEEKERVKDLEPVQTEKTRFEGLVHKLQAKCQAYHQDLADIKTKIKKDEAELDRLRKSEQEQESMLELATLDREMAEERAEQAEAELESLRQRLEEKELELDILHDEADLLTDDMSDDAKQAAGHHRLQTENARLKEALLRLKEITEETEDDLKARIRELEADQAHTQQLLEQKITLESQLLQQEETIEDLREQIDASNTWEDIVGELSEQNQLIKDQLAHKDAEVRDLENLKELNDELELHHIEQENDLRAELEAREDELAQHMHKVTEQDAALANQELLINKFRDLVLDLQSKMTDAESSKIMSDEQAKDVTGRFNEVMELNRRLHNAQVSTTAKMIMSELQRLEADEAKEELQIIKQYLVDAPEVHENESLAAYFRAKRVAFKSELARSILGTATASTSMSELSRFAVVNELSELHVKSTRFWSATTTCTWEQFASIQTYFEELCTVEQSLDRCIASLRSDEQSYEKLYTALRRTNEILGGVLADSQDVLATRPEDESIRRVSSMKNHLGLIKASLDTAKSCIEAVGITDAECEDGAQHVFERLSKPSHDAAANITAADKLIRVLDTLRQNSLYPQYPLGDEDMIMVETSLASTTRITHLFASKLCEFVVSHDAPVPASALLKHMAHLEDEHFANDELFKMADVIVKLNFWNEYGSVLMNNVEVEHGPAPWVLKSIEMEAAKVDRAEAEDNVQKLAIEHRNTLVQIRERDEIIETKDLEIDHLKAKAREVAAKLETMAGARKELDRVRCEYEEFRAQVGREIEELKRLEAQKDRTSTMEPSPVRSENISNTEVAPQKEIRTTSSSTAFLTVVSALENENHWLRHRQNAEIFSHTLQGLLSRIRNFQRDEARSKLQQRISDRMLSSSLSPEPSVLQSTPTSSRLSIPQTPQDKSALRESENLRRFGNRFRTPVVLTPPSSDSDWSPYASTPAMVFQDLNSEASLESFSPVGNSQLQAIMGVSPRTADLESFSEVVLENLPHEAFSEVIWENLEHEAFSEIPFVL